MSPDGRSVYVSDNVGGDTVSQYDVGAGGALSPKSPATVRRRRRPGRGGGEPGRPERLRRQLRQVQHAFTSGSVSQYDVAAGGALSPKSPATVLAGAGSRDVVVSPPARVPSTKAQCKDGGWRAFPQFKNQGDCVSYVATKGKRPPAG